MNSIALKTFPFKLMLSKKLKNITEYSGKYSKWLRSNSSLAIAIKSQIIEDVEEDSDFVDLGLPSGTKWATCNIGASKPEEYGKYFQWGATQGYEGDEAKAHSTWATTPFNNGSDSYDSAYFTANSGTWLTETAELKNEYDAAYVNTSGKQKMPTLDQIRELTANTTSTWTSVTASDGSTVYGRLFTSKTDETKYIFVPASGNFRNGSQNDVGSDGSVWSSSLDTDDPDYAFDLGFDSGNAGWRNNSRCFGFAVRGVKNPS